MILGSLSNGSAEEGPLSQSAMCLSSKCIDDVFNGLEACSSEVKSAL